MNTEGRSTVVGVFHDSGDAREAIEDLKDAGFDAKDIGILMKDKGEAGQMAQETGTHAGQGAATGLISGGILGGLAGWLVGIGALAIPGVGPFIAAGAFGTAIAGAGVGAGVGAIVGALIGMGIPKEEAQWYANEVHGGNTLVTVNAPGRYDQAETILHNKGAYDIQHRDAGMMNTEVTGSGRGSSTMEADTMQPGEYLDEDKYQDVSNRGFTGRESEDVVRLREEQLRVRKERTQAGEVGITKNVVSEEQSIDVPTTRDEVFVERRSMDRQPSDKPVGVNEDETIRVPVYEEQVHPEKETVVTEEVRLGKRPVQETQRVSDTVRHEEASLHNEGDLEVAGSENVPDHQHQWVNGRCEICGVSQQRRAA